METYWFIRLLELFRKPKATKLQKYGALQVQMAEALLWRDEEVSVGAILSPFNKQPIDVQERYLLDAYYLLNWIRNWDNKTNKESEK